MAMESGTTIAVLAIINLLRIIQLTKKFVNAARKNMGLPVIAIGAKRFWGSYEIQKGAMDCDSLQ